MPNSAKKNQHWVKNLAYMNILAKCADNRLSVYLSLYLCLEDFYCFHSLVCIDLLYCVNVRPLHKMYFGEFILEVSVYIMYLSSRRLGYR